MFAEDREDVPQEPEAGAPEEETPSEAAPEASEDAASDASEDSAPDASEDAAPDASEDAAPESDAPPADAVGPEIEGVEELVAETSAPGGEDVAAEAPAAEEPPPADEAPAERERRPKRDRAGQDEAADEVIPGAHLEPDLVLEETAREDSEFGQYGEDDASAAEGEPSAEGATETPGEPEPVARTPLELAADARYRATGKRKRAVARVILKPGEGTYSVNGRHLDEYFPRVRLQRMSRQPLEVTGNQSRMDVVARIHGGGVSAQATALRHGIARALVEADPSLRGELKRRGYLTRDPRVKERKKAGLKKARKRPQFSKR